MSKSQYHEADDATKRLNRLLINRNARAVNLAILPANYDTATSTLKVIYLRGNTGHSK